MAIPFENFRLHFINSYDWVENPDEPHETQTVKIVDHIDQMWLSFVAASKLRLLCLIHLTRSFEHVLAYLEGADVLKL